MRFVTAAALAALTAIPVAAQGRATLVFTGRFPFVSLDQPNERTGGSITDISEFAFTMVTPGAGAYARSWIPATTHEAYMGDVTGTGDFTPLRNLKSYFARINMAGVFMKHADKQSFDPRKIYWTVRDQESGIDILVPDQNGTTTVPVLPGDFVRLLPNGNIEYFITQALIAKAQGPQTGSYADGASAICQDAQGNLYYSPTEGGHWINGNNLLSGPIFAFDGSICMIQAQDITYDANGNVQDVVAGSAFLLFIETAGLNPTVRDMTGNAGAMTNTGTPIGNPAVIANVVGLELDPNGGTIQSTYTLGDPSAGGQPVTVPNLMWCVDNGTFGGSIFSSTAAPTGLPGTLAVINGVKCGSDVSGVPADGSWLGVQLDTGNFQPTLMGLLAIPEVPFTPLVHDTPDFGALDPAATNLAMDYHGTPNAGLFILLTFGPSANGAVAPSIDFGMGFGPASYNTLFTIPTPLIPVPISAFLGTTDANGYASFVIPNPNTPSTMGTLLMTQGVAVSGGGFQVCNPALIHYK